MIITQPSKTGVSDNLDKKMLKNKMFFVAFYIDID
jgi:hypothetical protein